MLDLKGYWCGIEQVGAIYKIMVIAIKYRTRGRYEVTMKVSSLYDSSSHKCECALLGATN